ncbi:Uncharacterised protein [Niallia circulans]|uniref:hypothetical protein n=1 Tax=Niallia circulans TaxID=1397 RepID=UPI000DA0C479|nr:hypothetical protein [Niallia circulans]MED4245971.1 hypothetical protein [Niallia circulans]MED4249986.1 hypothetical protein [Niallia circulans]SPT83465.1 Uncharacterised protein [Niallia circulans]
MLQKWKGSNYVTTRAMESKNRIGRVRICIFYVLLKYIVPIVLIIVILDAAGLSG